MKLLSAETVDSPWLVFVAMDAVDVLVVVGVAFHYNSMIIVSLVVIWHQLSYLVKNYYARSRTPLTLKKNPSANEF
jgi:hypothetical protein